MLKLNLGGGSNKEHLPKGFINVDIGEFADVKWNLDEYPYPFKADSVDRIIAWHILEHLKEPFDFFAECYRIMKKGARMEIKCPHVAALGGAFGTFEHRHYFHESAIDSVTGEIGSSIFPYKFKHIKTEVSHGRFLFWQKREIKWVIEK